MKVINVLSLVAYDKVQLFDTFIVQIIRAVKSVEIYRVWSEGFIEAKIN